MVTIARICAYFTGGLPRLIIKLVKRVSVFDLPRGSRRAVEKWGILMFSGSRIPPSAVGGKDQIEALGQALEAADAVIIGAGAGLSASAGLRTLLKTMDELYQVRHVSSLRRVAVSVILSLLFLLTIYLSIVVIFTGGWFFQLLEARLPSPLAELIPLLTSLWLLPSVFPSTKVQARRKFDFLADMLARMGVPLVDDETRRLIDEFFARIPDGVYQDDPAGP